MIFPTSIQLLLGQRIQDRVDYMKEASWLWTPILVKKLGKDPLSFFSAETSLLTSRVKDEGILSKTEAAFLNRPVFNNCPKFIRTRPIRLIVAAMESINSSFLTVIPSATWPKSAILHLGWNPSFRDVTAVHLGAHLPVAHP